MERFLLFILLLGRPGCGKSTVSKILTEKFRTEGLAHKFERVDDFPTLQEFLDKDIGFKRHVRRDGGFVVTEWTIIDEVLQEISKRVFETTSVGKVIFIEFSRSDHQEALANFSPEFVRRSVILYIKASFETCMRRNEERFRKTGEKSLDDHVVPLDLMQSYYKVDDIETMLDTAGERRVREGLPPRLFILDNNFHGLDRLNSSLDQFVWFYKTLH